MTILLYVAATRATQKLVITYSNDEGFGKRLISPAT